MRRGKNAIKMEFLNIASTFGAFTSGWNKFCAKKWETKIKKNEK